MPYDPAWDMPAINWRPQSPFTVPQTPPAVRPDAGTPVCIGPIAAEWLNWLVGCVDAGKVPDSWIVADDAQQYQVQSDVDTLKAIIATKRCTGAPMIRFTPACGLETSSDGGVTWVAVPGWSDNFAACVRQNMPPPIPPNPGPSPIEQHACNLAGYLAKEVIQYSMAHMVSGITLMDPEVKILREIIDFIPGANLALDSVTQSLSALYDTVTGGTLAHYTFASTDAALWSLVTCAIFNAIRTAGYVTAANFAAVGVNLLAITYIYPEVINAIGFYFIQLGLPGIQAMQVVGAVDTVDCTDCGTWCHEFDFRVSDQGWVAYMGAVPGGDATYVPGVGWESVNFGGQTYCDIYFAFPHALALIHGNLTFKADLAAGGQTRHYDFRLGGVQQLAVNIDPNVELAYTHSSTGAIAVTADAMYLILRSAGVGQNIIQSAQLSGNGPDPFGAQNCTY